MSADQAPGLEFTGWAELKYAITELQYLAVRLGARSRHADDENTDAIMWADASWRAADLYERTLANLGTLAGPVRQARDTQPAAIAHLPCQGPAMAP